MAGECIPWRGTTNRDGYGVMPGSVNGSRLAHRAVLAEKLGRPVQGVARHTCDNPVCINPEHLIEGTQRDNIADMHERGRRQYNRKTHCVHGHSLAGLPLSVKGDGTSWRRCVECRRLSHAKQSAARKAARAARKEMV